MSASKKSGGSSQCCPCGDSCFSTNSKGTRKFSKRNKRVKSGPVPKNSGDCCDFDFGPDTGLHPGTPGGNPPCFQGEKDANGTRMKNKNKIKNELKDKIKEACPNMSDEEANEKAQDAVDDIESDMADKADRAGVPDKDHDGAGQETPCSFTTCYDDLNVDPNSGTVTGGGGNSLPNSDAHTDDNCNPNPPNYGNPPNFPNPGPIPNPPL